MLLETEHLGGYVSSNEAQSVFENSIETNERYSNNNNNNNNEIRNIVDDNGFTIGCGTPIQNFYAGQSIFITGGTGFLGKVLIEKLLRSCPEISTIYLLIRAKKNRNVEDRIEDLFSDPVYDRLREEMPKFRHKVVAISGDCSIRGLGLSSTDRERLIQEVSIVFHSAATVRFDEKMSIALAINVGSASDMIDLCKRMQRLKSFIHVSTAYANCQKPMIDELFYTHPSKYEDLDAMLSGMQDEEIEAITPKLLGEWPNTYTFTKALAEIVVKEKNDGLKMGIFRPAIVISTAYEPIPGWIDNFYGPTGAVAAVASGILKTMYCDENTHANIVPVDFTVNALIVSAWDVANQTSRRNDDMLIYNYVSTVESSLTWKEYCDINMIYAKEFPLSQAQWTISLSLHTSKIMHVLSKLILHYLPALFFDFFSFFLGHRPRYMKTYRKIHKFLSALSWFSIREWTFRNDNVQTMWKRLDPKDRQNFRFSIKDLDWSIFLRHYMKGVRIYLLKDDLSTLEASRKRAKKLLWMSRTAKMLMFTLLMWFIWKIISAVFY